MKTTILLFTVGLSLIASAQQPFVHEVVRKTNVANVAASGVIAAHQIVTVADIAQVGVIQNGQFRAFDQPAIGIVSVATNLLDKAPATKPLLSAQRQSPKIAIPQAAKTAAKISGPVPPPPSSNSMAYVNWAMRNNVTNALPPMAPTNSPIYRRFAEWKKTTK